jgi:hypothetical protein
MRLHTTTFLYLGLLLVGVALFLALILLPDNKHVEADDAKGGTAPPSIERTVEWPL